MKIHSYILGRGNAAQAIRKGLAIASAIHPEWSVSPIVQLERGTRLSEIKQKGDAVGILFLANPHGLHCKSLLEADTAGFRHIFVEKPVCVRKSEVAELRKLKTHVSIFHGYRQMWGPRLIKNAIESGDVGDVITVEGRYWQSSAAQRSLEKSPASGSWKNTVELSGEFDAYLDLGTHWADLMFYFAGEKPQGGSVWRSFANAEAPHRDTHVRVTLHFHKLGPTLGSLSKTFHGAGNGLEINVIGSKQSLSWSFEDPDRVKIGKGSAIEITTRPRSVPSAAHLAPFHGAGWLEGYVDVISKVFSSLETGEKPDVPLLHEGLDVVETLLSLPTA